MKYVKPEIEVINVKDNIFMAFSGNFTCPPYDSSNPGNCQNYDGNGVHCGDYQQGSKCENFSNASFTCRAYNGYSGTINGKWVENGAPACGVF